jgi:hypothetical protein
VWDEIVRLLPDFENAVLTGLDNEGYPYSVRVRPQADPTRRAIGVPLPAHAPVQDGPASLLCHAHDEDLWNLRSFLVRGSYVGKRGFGPSNPAPSCPAPGSGGRWAWCGSSGGLGRTPSAT